MTGPGFVKELDTPTLHHGLDFYRGGLSYVTSRGGGGEVKGTVSRDYLLLGFFMNQFPPAPEYPIRTVLNFFENSRRYSQVKVHHRYQRHRRQIRKSRGTVPLNPEINTYLDTL